MQVFLAPLTICLALTVRVFSSSPQSRRSQRQRTTSTAPAVPGRSFSESPGEGGTPDRTSRFLGFVAVAVATVKH